VLILRVCVLVAPAAATARAEPAPGPGGLVALSERGGIVVVDPATGDRRALTPGESYDYQPTWSPDGSQLAFARAVPDGRGSLSDSGIWAVDLAARQERRLTPEGLGLNVRYPAWSPDGTRIAATDEDGLIVVDLAGGPIRHIERSGYALTWSLDGSQLAYVGLEPLDDVGEYSDSFIEVVGITPAAPPRRLTSGGDDEYPVWSPDGESLAYSTIASGEVSEVHVLTRDGVDRVVGHGRFPAWSPDGRLLAFAAPGSDDAERLVVHDLAAGSTRVVLERTGGFISDVSWSPDGRQLAFRDQADAGSFAVTVGGEDLRPLSPASSTRDPVWGPGVVQRSAGATRVHTAVTLSRSTVETATAVVVASAGTYADALAGAPLARGLGAPILLTGAEGLDPAVADEVRRLSPSEAVVLGGGAALSPQVDRDLRVLGIETVRRIAGPDRFATAARIAAELGARGDAYLLQGIDADPARGWPDAVAAAPVAAAAGVPILLTASDGLPDATADALAALDVRRVTIRRWARGGGRAGQGRPSCSGDRGGQPARRRRPVRHRGGRRRAGARRWRVGVVRLARDRPVMAGRGHRGPPAHPRRARRWRDLPVASTACGRACRCASPRWS
jgi:Tol biopolymer transport system component